MCGQSLMCVTDRIKGARMTEKTVQELERVARTGDNAAARALLFEILAKVRTVKDATEAGSGSVLPMKRA
jgi:hypothetical protein